MQEGRKIQATDCTDRSVQSVKSVAVFMYYGPHRFMLARIILALFCVGAGVAAFASVRNDLATRVDLARVDYVQSETCRRCHADHYRTWRQTFHRTMTQEARPGAVLGDFENATYTYDGVTSRFTRDGDAYYVETL